MTPFDRRREADRGQDDETADLLRRALAREAGGVTPSGDGLARILAAAGSTGTPGNASRNTVGNTAGGSAGGTPRGAGRRLRRPARWLPVLAAAAAVTMLLGGLGALRLAGLRADRLAAVSGPAARFNDPSAPAAQPLPVYLVERQQQRWALVREFVPTTLTAPDARLDAALRLSVAGAATDPDHTSVWAALAGAAAGAGTGLDLAADAVDGTASDGRVTIRLSASTAAEPPAGSSAVTARGILSGIFPGSDPADATATATATARLAVQQLVWTATAVTGMTSPVRIQGVSATTALFGQLPLGRDFVRTFGADDPRAPVWVSSVSDGQRLAVGTATVRGDAVTTSTGAVGWRLRDADGATVSSGIAPLRREDGHPAAVGERGVWALTVTLPTPGRYLLEVSQVWPQAAATDPQWRDTKTLIAA